MPEPLVLTVDAGHERLRLDRWLAGALADHSRSEIQRWIDDGLVTVAGRPAKASQKVEPGQMVAVAVPESPAEPALAPEDLPLTIVYEDDDLIVVDKPAGLVVHPAPGHTGGTLVNAILHHAPDIAGVGGERRPGIVHRLDKETSGLIVVAKNDRAHRHLQAQFAARTVYKEYLALLEGRLQPEHGRISAPIGRHPTDRKRQAVLPVDPVTGVSPGREAVTEYRVLQVYSPPIYGSSTSVGTFSLVSAVLHTGRTHQIRVHFAWLKHPVVGDMLYGYRTQRLPVGRQFLHAHRLRLRLPGTGEESEFVAPLPGELEGILVKLEMI
jgi:23S rRNA pseudouridine1911/1915/1917 synthase